MKVIFKQMEKYYPIEPGGISDDRGRSSSSGCWVGPVLMKQGLRAVDRDVVMAYLE